MKSIFAKFAFALAGVWFVTCAHAIDMPELAIKQGCNNCHKIDKKFVGPTFVEVSKKYKGNETAIAKLSKKIITGGSGAWGPVPMPGYPTLSDPEVGELVAFILKLSN
ncbi:MAG: c-type cytochrome [Gallionella sp.]